MQSALSGPTSRSLVLTIGNEATRAIVRVTCLSLYAILTLDMNPIHKRDLRVIHEIFSIWRGIPLTFDLLINRCGRDAVRWKQFSVGIKSTWIQVGLHSMFRSEDESVGQAS